MNLQYEWVGMKVTLKRVISPSVAPMLQVLWEQGYVARKVYMYVYCMVCMALMNTMVLRTKPQDSYVSVNACGARSVLFLTFIHKGARVAQWARALS